MADFKSGKIRENLEWSIEDNIFVKLETHFIIDLSNTPVNVKIYRYYAFYVEPDSKGADALSYKSGSEFFYAFLPLSTCFEKHWMWQSKRSNSCSLLYNPGMIHKGYKNFGDPLLKKLVKKLCISFTGEKPFPRFRTQNYYPVMYQEIVPDCKHYHSLLAQ